MSLWVVMVLKFIKLSCHNHQHLLYCRRHNHRYHRCFRYGVCPTYCKHMKKTARRAWVLVREELVTDWQVKGAQAIGLSPHSPPHPNPPHFPPSSEFLASDWEDRQNGHPRRQESSSRSAGHSVRGQRMQRPPFLSLLLSPPPIHLHLHSAHVSLRFVDQCFIGEKMKCMGFLPPAQRIKRRIGPDKVGASRGSSAKTVRIERISPPSLTDFQHLPNKTDL